MTRKINKSQTNETKRYYEVPSEKVQEWSDTIENLAKQRDQYKTERDTLIDDLSWYKAKVSRLERENEKYNEQFTEYIDETYMYLKLLSEISQHIGKKPSSNKYKHFRAKLDGIGIKEDE